MILFYIAVVLVITGILFILYSEFFEASIRKTIPHDRFVPNLDDDFSETKYEISNAPFVSKKDEIELSDLPDIDIELSDEFDTGQQKDTNIIVKDKEDKIIQHNETKRYEVVLYIDNSGTIGNVSDTVSSNDWSFLSRIGSGYLQYVQQGLNITINNKLYRYDFYRIASMKAHDNYMLFTIKGKNAINCIVLNEESDILMDIEKEYLKFNESQF